MKNPLYRAFVEAGHEAGYITTEDPNGFMQSFGPMHMTVKDGVRWSTANAYLKPAMSRPNLMITHAMTRRVLLEGKRAMGSSMTIWGQRNVAKARHRCSFRAGPIAAPHLLQRSGIGPTRCRKSRRRSPARPAGVR